MIGFYTSMCSFLVANINGVILKVSTAFTSAPLQENTVSHFCIHMRFSLEQNQIYTLLVADNLEMNVCVLL